MAAFLWRWTVRVVVVAVLAFMAVYSIDFAVFKLRGSPQGKVTVNRYVSIPLKGQRTEYDYQGTLDAPCAEALFGQNGLSACWQLRKNPNQGMAL
ncbi:MAG: hypothetical protein P4L03_06690 [Terracidiphilus sp.]|nr:hypothetical protein [Terracidiphilus sp.]